MRPSRSNHPWKVWRPLIPIPVDNLSSCPPRSPAVLLGVSPPWPSSLTHSPDLTHKQCTLYAYQLMHTHVFMCEPVFSLCVWGGHFLFQLPAGSLQHSQLEPSIPAGGMTAPGTHMRGLAGGAVEETSLSSEACPGFQKDLLDQKLTPTSPPTLCTEPRIHSQTLCAMGLGRVQP